MVYLAIGHTNEYGYMPDTTNFVVGFTTEERKNAFVEKIDSTLCEPQYREDACYADVAKLIESMADMYDEIVVIKKTDFFYWD